MEEEKHWLDTRNNSARRIAAVVGVAICFGLFVGSWFASVPLSVKVLASATGLAGVVVEVYAFRRLSRIVEQQRIAAEAGSSNEK